MTLRELLSEIGYTVAEDDLQGSVLETELYVATDTHGGDLRPIVGAARHTGHEEIPDVGDVDSDPCIVLETGKP